MTKRLLFTYTLSGLIFYSSCYTDDSSQPSLNRLPFEDFTEFFESNNDIADTLSFNADTDAMVTSPKGTVINIPANTFSAGGDIFLEVKEATTKSDFLFLNKPTLDGTELIESSGAIFIKPFANGNQINIDNPLQINMSLPAGTTADGMEYYHYENEWAIDAVNQIVDNTNSISYESTRASWQMGAKSFTNSGTAQISINPAGYGTIPHDMRAFLIFSDQNIVSPLNYDVSSVTASGTVPTGTEVNIVVLVMDHFKLSVGIETLVIDNDSDIDVSMNIVNVEEMKTMIKGLD